MSGRRAAVASILVIALLPLLGPAPARAAVAPVQSLALRGSATPLEVVVTWAVLDRSVYAGARLVVMAGDLVPSGPDDSRAVHRADVPASDLTAIWTAPPVGAAYTVTVFARDSTGAFAGPATVPLRVPGNVRHLVVESYRGAWAVGAWVLPPSADAAVLCYARDGAPAGPSTAERCSPPGAYQGQVDTPSGFGTFSTAQFSAFARAGGTGVLGPRSLVVGETPPPFSAHRLTSTGAGARRVKLQWDNGFQEPGGVLHGPGGTLTWLVYRAEGRSSPAVAGADGVVEVPAPDDWRVVHVVRGLKRDTAYTFAIRGRDAEGNLSDWSEPLTTATRRPGLTVVSDDGRDRRWRRSRVPATRTSWDGSAARTGGGGVVVGSVTETDAGQKVRIATTRPGEWWHQRVTARAGYRHLAVDPRSGTIFAATFDCIHSKRPGRAWRTRWCSDGQVNDGVHSLVLDRTGHVHALVDMLAGTSYVTNTGGRWRVQARPQPDRSYVPMLLRYDRSTDSLALVVVGPSADELLVATRRRSDSRFGPWRSWYRSTSPDRLFSLSSAAADGGRLVVAVTTRRATGGAWGQPMLVTGRLTGRATAQTVRGTVFESLGPAVAVRGRRLHVAWTWATDLPGHPAEGVWSSGGRWDGDRRRWVMSRPDRRTVSAYDRVLDLDLGAGGRASLLVRTVAQEYERLRPG